MGKMNKLQKLQNEEWRNLNRRRSPRLLELEEKREKEAREKILAEEKEEEEGLKNQEQQQQQQAEAEAAEDTQTESKENEEGIEKVEDEEEVNLLQQQGKRTMSDDDGDEDKKKFLASVGTSSRKKGKRTRNIEDILNSTSPIRESSQVVQETQHSDHNTTSGKRDKTPQISRRDTYFYYNDYKPPFFSTGLLDDAQKELQYNEEAGSGSYEESLMRFTRGLGPVAQRVAAQKLEALKRSQLPPPGPSAAPTPEGEDDEDAAAAAGFINKEAESGAKGKAKEASPEEP